MRRVAKGFHLAVLVLAVVLLAAACSGASSTENGEKEPDKKSWQDYYDLGVRYLSEGNYEEAIIAFTAAIEIDPSRPEAYVGRGDAYRGKGDPGADLNAALSDYLKAVECGDAEEDTQRKIKEIYIAQGDTESAIDMLLETEDITPGSATEEQLFELLDLYAGDGSALDVAKYLFTDKVVRPSEWTINGVPLRDVGADDIKATARGDWIDGPYDVYNTTTGTYAEVTRCGSGKYWDEFEIDKGTQRFKHAKYEVFSTECRGIRPGMSARECLVQLGVSEIGVEYLLRQMRKSKESPTRKWYAYDYNVLVDSEASESWQLETGQWITYNGVAELQWCLNYFFNDEETGTWMEMILFLCDENENIRQIHYAPEIDGVITFGP